MKRKDYFSGKRILVTGASGTVGKVLVEKLLEHDIVELRAFDNNESGLFFLGRKYKADTRLNVFIGDVREPGSIARIAEGVDVIFHGAALKHVLVCERSPFEAVQTNIIGVENIISVALQKNVSKVIFMSSDKAVNPTNVMGTSKLMGERLMTAANSMRSRPEPAFASIRFGNILGSRGSVLPLFISQLRHGKDLTLTDNRMTRFVMSAEQAVDFALRSAVLAKGGEVFVSKMPVIRIKDLATVTIAALAGEYGRNVNDVAVETIGSQAGEKLYEELLSEDEAERSLELDNCYCVLPAFRSLYSEIRYDYEGIVSNSVRHSYRSDKELAMSKDELESFINRENILTNTELAETS